MNKEIKAILFDLDGLVLVGRKRLFSEQFAEEQKVPLDVVREFFVKDLKPCSMGKADLKEKVAPYLPRWKWNGTVDDFLMHWFSCCCEFDQQVLDIIVDLQKADVKCYVATRQEKYRLTYVMEGQGLQHWFDGTFATCDIGFDKCEPEYWDHVLQTLGIEPEEILYFDDSEKNVDMAKMLGIDAHHYTGREVLDREVAAILA